MRYWYAMSFREELDMLRCQLTEHAERVHKFVVMEATVDHAGVPKPLVLQDHWDEFAQWHDKIEYVTTTHDYGSFWAREQNQRNIGMPYITGSAADDDIVIVSDVDEFVPVSAFGVQPDPCVGLVQRLRFAAVDWDGSPGVTAVMARAAVLKDGRFTCDTLRQQRESFPPVSPGGYHFSWFGGPERVRRKAVASPHQEALHAAFDISRGYAWEKGMGAVGPGMGVVVEIEDDYPVQVQCRECPWYWWRPGPDNLPVDDLAREREVERRRLAPVELRTCAEGREARLLEPGSYHTGDLTPCPTALYS